MRSICFIDVSICIEASIHLFIEVSLEVKRVLLIYKGLF